MDITDMEITRTSKIENSLAGQNFYEDIKIITESGNSVLCWVANSLEEANKEYGRLAWVFEAKNKNNDNEACFYLCHHLTNNKISESIFDYNFATPLSQFEKNSLEKTTSVLEILRGLSGVLTAISLIGWGLGMFDKNPRITVISLFLTMIFAGSTWASNKVITEKKGYKNG